jgi:hypothetical protein
MMRLLENVQPFFSRFLRHDNLRKCIACCATGPITFDFRCLDRSASRLAHARRDVTNENRSYTLLLPTMKRSSAW